MAIESRSYWDIEPYGDSLLVTADPQEIAIRNVFGGETIRRSSKELIAGSLAFNFAYKINCSRQSGLIVVWNSSNIYILNNSLESVGEYYTFDGNILSLRISNETKVVAFEERKMSPFSSNFILVSSQGDVLEQLPMRAVMGGIENTLIWEKNETSFEGGRFLCRFFSKIAPGASQGAGRTYALNWDIKSGKTTTQAILESRLYPMERDFLEIGSDFIRLWSPKK